MKKALMIGLAVLVLAGGFWWWRRSRPAPAPPAPPPPTAEVSVVPLRTGVLAETLAVFGTIVSTASGDRVSVAPFDGVVAAVNVATGTAVNQGDDLVDVEPSPDMKLQFRNATSDFANATKALASTQQRHDLQLATNQELLAAQQAERTARLKLESYRARGLGGRAPVGAPVGGVVTTVPATVGSLVLAGAPLAVVTAAGGLEAHLGVEAADLDRVKPGDPVTLTSINRRQIAPLKVSVRVVGRNLDPLTGLAGVRAALPADAGLMAAEHVTGSIEVKRRTGLIVPRGAVLPENGRSVLYTVQGAKAVRHEVTVELDAGAWLEISGPDLRPGESAVQLGNYELREGMAVQIAPPANAPAGSTP